MDKEVVIYEKREAVATITLNRPDSKNAINLELIERLEDVQREITSDSDIKVVILTAMGAEAFSVGIDREEFRPKKDKDDLRGFLSITSIIDALGQPSIAAINGDALGQGLELALACDLRICDETGHFSMNHLHHGVIPWNGGTQRLPRIVGRGKAMEMIVTGVIIDAQEAYRIGLVNKVVPAAELLTVTMDMAREMACKGPVALRYAKEAIHKGMDLTLEQGLRLEADLYFLLHTTKDRTEGIRAFQEKSSPRFEGR